MEYDKVLKAVNKNLYWLNVNARHAIELQETFVFPAYDTSLRELIKGTNKVRCYKVCLEAIYFDYVMTLMRMYDSYQRDVMCFEGLFECLTDDFILEFEKINQRRIKTCIDESYAEYKELKGSHLVSRLTTIRHKMYAHTAANFNSNQFAEYGHAEELLSKTLTMLNSVINSIWNKEEPYEKIIQAWKNYAIEFWQVFFCGNEQRPTNQLSGQRETQVP